MHSRDLYGIFLCLIPRPSSKPQLAAVDRPLLLSLYGSIFHVLLVPSSPLCAVYSGYLAIVQSGFITLPPSTKKRRARADCAESSPLPLRLSLALALAQ